MHVEALVAKGSANIGFAIQPVDDSRFDKIPLTSYQLYAIVNCEHPLSSKIYFDYKDLNEQQLIIENDGFKLHQIIMEQYQRKNVQPNLVFETSGLILCHKMVRQNKGISVTVDYML